MNRNTVIIIGEITAGPRLAGREIVAAEQVTLLRRKEKPA